LVCFRAGRRASHSPMQSYTLYPSRVRLALAAIFAALSFQSAFGQLVVNGGTTTVSTAISPSGTIVKNGTLNVIWGGAINNGTNNAVIGESSAGLGVLNVTSGSSLLAQYFDVGQGTGSSGIVDVAGAGSLVSIASNTSIGGHGNGLMFVTDGAVFHSADYMGIGQDAGGDGKVYVSSGGTLLADQQLHLGEGYLGASTGRLSVGGAGSSVHVAQHLLVGQWGTGELTVGDGATVSAAGNFSVGTQAGSSGSVLVDGAGSKVSTAANAYLGAGGAGTMTLSNGGSFHASDWSALGVDTVGTLNVSSGGTATFDNTLSVGHNSGGVGH